MPALNDVNPEEFIWKTYLRASKDEDEIRPKNWEGSTTGILTFVCGYHFGIVTFY